ncbi:polysaccharide biosynthesis protein [Phycisphaerae bacterium]|jgi:perosamine synthetase|nr:polysaccharide biosynthesis protein [Phycisphaerae bacterium]
MTSPNEIPLSRPDITALEEELVLRTLRSGRLSIGPVVEQFEAAVAARVGCHHGIAVNSGTSGLHMCMLGLGIGPGDEVITTPFSFIASANCILMTGATPVFVDICPRTLNMDPAKVEAAIGKRTKAILAVETFGNPAYFDQYTAIAARHELPMIEDCCEALGATLKGRPAGHFGRCGVFGFYPNKQITTGEGGLIVTDDARFADMCRSLRNQGRPLGWSAPKAAEPTHGGTATGSWLRHERLGYNYRMSEINAALGVAQMRRLDEMIAKRQRVSRWYMERLGGHKDLVLPTVEDDVNMSWFVYVVRLAPSYTSDERDRIIRGLRAHDIGASDYFPCIHLQTHFRELGFRPGMFPIAESVSNRTIALPFFNDMTQKDIDIVVGTLELMISRENLGRG